MEYNGNKKNMPEVTEMDAKEKALKAHEEWAGKIEVVARCKVE